MYLKSLPTTIPIHLYAKKIWLNKADYAPKQVSVSDANAKVVVDVKFEKFEFGTKFEKEAFDMQKNMSVNTGEGQAPAEGTITEPSESGETVPQVNEEVATPENNVGEADPETESRTPEANAPGAEVDSEQTPEGDSAEAPESTDETTGAIEIPELGDFGVIEPTYLPEGVDFKGEPTIMETEEDYAVMLRFEGTYNYTIIEARPQDRASSYAVTSPVDLGFTIGMITTELPRTLTWFDEGMEYRITSDDLPESEMVKIAASMQDQSGK